MPPVIPLAPDDYTYTTHTYSSHNGTCAHNQFLSGYLENPFFSTEKDNTGRASILDRSSSTDHRKDL